MEYTQHKVTCEYSDWELNKVEQCQSVVQVRVSNF